MKHLKILSLCLATLLAVACGKDDSKSQSSDNIYQFSVADGQGDSVSLAAYRGQVLLVVNTATQCGYTPQYTSLENLYQTYRDQGFTILDFPCNQFGAQAPGNYDQIHDFCTGEYNISFPQFAKINVNGNQASPLFTWLKTKAKEGGMSQYTDIQWNFTKFLINRQGEVIGRFEPSAMSAMTQAVREEMSK